MDISHPKLGVSVNAVCPGTLHSKMMQAREDTISTQDSADIISYLATMRMEGVGDCSVPHSDMPRGEVLWHDLSRTVTRGCHVDSTRGVTG